MKYSDDSYLRKWHIIGCKKRDIPPLIPVGLSTWDRWVREGKAPQPVIKQNGFIAWRYSDVIAFRDSLDSAA